MKKICKIIGICALTCFSFYYTKEIIEISKSKDPIMIKIIKESENYNVEAVNAVLEDNYIIPGINGKKVDINKSYEKMKKLGEYNANLLVFVSDYPDISIKNNYDKFIIKGNDQKPEVSLIFKVDATNNINSILKILKSKEAPATFFVEDNLIEENSSLLKDIIKDGHQIEPLGTSGNYTESKLKIANNTIKNITDENAKYCYSENDNKETLELCSKNNMYTIRPSLISTTYAYKDIKNNLQAGNIFSLSINDYTKDELAIIISFIRQKGYDIVSLDELLDEE